MSFKEEYIFWKLAYFFIAEQGYRIVQLFENQRELWLEKLENKNEPIIRLLSHPLDWSNKLQRDIEFTAVNGERIRKQLGRSKLNVMNICISPFPPVDDYEFRLRDPYVFPEGQKTTVTTIMMTAGLYKKGFEQLSQRYDSEVTFQIAEDYPQEEVETLKKAALHAATKQAKAEKEVFTNKRPLFTYGLMGFQVLVFFWLELHGGSTNTATLIKYGAKVNPLIYEGEWWRFITPVFLHIGFLHIAMNTLALYYLGMVVEKIYGHVRFLLIYLFAGITGFIASFLFSTNLSAGASGAIFGCFGALLYFGMIHPSLFSRTMGRNVLFILGLNLALGFSTTGIDNAGHLGGLLGGFLAAGIVHFPKKKKPLLQLLFFILSAAVVWGSLAYGFSEPVRDKDQSTSLYIAQDYIKKHQYDQAYQILKKSEKNIENPSAQLYFLLSFSEIKKDMLPDAKSHLLKAIKMDPKLDEADYNLALVYLEENNLKEAKRYADRASVLKPDSQQYADLVKEINGRIQSIGGGI